MKKNLCEIKYVRILLVAGCSCLISINSAAADFKISDTESPRPSERQENNVSSRPGEQIDQGAAKVITDIFTGSSTEQKRATEKRDYSKSSKAPRRVPNYQAQERSSQVNCVDAACKQEALDQIALAHEQIAWMESNESHYNDFHPKLTFVKEKLDAAVQMLTNGCATSFGHGSSAGPASQSHRN